MYMYTVFYYDFIQEFPHTRGEDDLPDLSLKKTSEMHNQTTHSRLPSGRPRWGGNSSRGSAIHRTPEGEGLTFRTKSLISILPSKKPEPSTSRGFFDGRNARLRVIRPTSSDEVESQQTTSTSAGTDRTPDGRALSLHSHDQQAAAPYY